MMKQILHSCALRSFSMLFLLSLPLAPVIAQPYPASSYKLDDTGKVLVEWKGSEAVIDMQADPILSQVTTIDERAFWLRRSLTSITLPEGLTSIGDYAFSDCSSLTSIKIPEKVISIGERAFARCESLASISLSEDLTSIGEWAFFGCQSLTSISLPDNLTAISNYAFNACSLLTSITLPEGLTSIGIRAFARCGSLASIKIPDKVISIGEAAFSDCEKLANITLPEDLTSIGGSTFEGCSSLVSITLPEGLTSIGESAFAHCLLLTSLQIPKAVEKIGRGIIQRSGVQTVFCYLNEPLKGVDSQAFIKDPKPQTLYVLPGKREAYVSAGWDKYFGKIVEMGASDAKYRISLKIQGEGTVAITGFDDLTKVPHETELTVVPKPKEGWTLSKLTANGADIIATKKFVVKEAAEVVATFVKQTHVITMRTTKAIGEKIALTIVAEGDVSIDGATGTFVNDERIEYTLVKQTITIEGKVTTLYCIENQITSLDLSQNTDLKSLDCESNQLTKLDVSKNTALTNLGCNSNQLTNLDVSQNAVLKKLWCYNNQLTNLDLSKNTVLKDLWCSINQLTNLDVSANTALTFLTCSFNQLTNLDVSANTALTYLRCFSNQLTKLDVSKNTALTMLFCFSNQIKDEAMTTLVKSLPTGKKGDFHVINTRDAKEQNVCTKANVAIAKAKGWKVYDSNGRPDDRKEYVGSENTSVAAINSSSVQIYPNPAKDFVQIKGAKAAAAVRLYSLDGRLVLIANADTDGAVRLDVAKLPASTYLLSIDFAYSRRISVVR